MLEICRSVSTRQHQPHAINTTTLLSVIMATSKRLTPIKIPNKNTRTHRRKLAGAAPKSTVHHPTPYLHPEKLTSFTAPSRSADESYQRLEDLTIHRPPHTRSADEEQAAIAEAHQVETQNVAPREVAYRAT